MPKTHKLLEVEQKHLRSVKNIFGALNSWSNTIEYILGLIDKDMQTYVKDVVQKRLKIESKEGDKPDVNVNIEEGTVEEL